MVPATAKLVRLGYLFTMIAGYDSSSIGAYMTNILDLLYLLRTADIPNSSGLKRQIVGIQ